MNTQPLIPVNLSAEECRTLLVFFTQPNAYTPASVKPEPDRAAIVGLLNRRYGSLVLTEERSIAPNAVAV